MTWIRKTKKALGIKENPNKDWKKKKTKRG